MTQIRDPTPSSLTHSSEIQKTVAGRALPAPVNRVWGVYDPHPFSCFTFDPPIFSPRAAEAMLPHLAQDGSQRLEPVSGGRTSVFRSKSDTGATTALLVVSCVFFFPPPPFCIEPNTPQTGSHGRSNHPEDSFTILRIQDTHIDVAVRFIRNAHLILILGFAV